MKKQEITNDFGIKVPRILYFLLVCCYVVPLVLYTPFVRYIGIYTFEQYFQVIKYPMMIFGYALNPLMAISYCFLFRKMIMGLKNEPESIRKFNIRLKYFYLIVISSAIAFAIASAIAWTLATKSRIGELEVFQGKSPFWPLLFINLSLVCDESLIFFILFMQKLEKLLWKVGFDGKTLSMNIFARNMCTIGFSSLGCFGLVVSTLMVPANFNQGFGFVLRVIIPIVVFCFLCIVFLEFLLISDTSYIVKGVQKSVYKLENKDYTVTDLKIITRSELGVLANSINTMKNATKDILYKFIKSTNDIIKKSKKLDDYMTDTRNSVVDITKIIQKVNDDSTNQRNEISKSNVAVDKIIKNIDNLNNAVNLQTQAVYDSTASVEQMVKSVQSVSEILEKNTINVNHLTMASEEGNDIVKSAVDASTKVLEQLKNLSTASAAIQDIASRTSLLAMNASIESAHAGAAGKGFAVVANEIRKLSTQSTSQVEQINTTLKLFSESIVSIAEKIKQVQDSFQAIYNFAQTVKAQESVISTAMQEQTLSNQKVYDAIQSINDATDSVHSGSIEMLNNGKDIENIIRNFESLAISISSDVQKISVLSKDIDANVDLSKESSNETYTNLQHLQKDLLNYKI